MGRDVETDTLVEKAVEEDGDVIETSALPPTAMNQKKVLGEALKSTGHKDKFLTVVGGAPCTPGWAARIGAGAYAEDAQDGVVKIKKLWAQK